LISKKKFLGILLVVLVSALSISGVVFESTKVSVNANPETTVGGIIGENTTWTLDNSPYIITDTVQIPENVVLEIEPGVTVIFEGVGDMFLVSGVIRAQGTDSSKIMFEGNGTSNFFNVVQSDNSSLYLEHCILRDGIKLWSIAYGITQVILRHSKLVNITNDSTFYHWRKVCYIEYNIFVDTAGFRMYNWFGKDSGATVYIRHNLVKENRDFFVLCSPNVYNQEIVVKYNSFIDVDGIVLALLSGLGDVAVTATENYWGTTDTTIVDSLIYDKNDVITSPNFIEYMPILAEPHPDTPTLPIRVSVEYSPVALYANVAVDFDATTSFGEYSSIANYTWNFGDDTIVTLDEPIATHTFVSSGEYNVTLTVTDEFGFQNDTSITITVLEDTTPPVTTDDYDVTWHTSDFTIILTAVDEGSGVAETYYRINDGPIMTVSAAGQPVITSEGADNTLEYWSVDNAGNEESSNILTGIMLDKTPPAIGSPSRIPESDILPDQGVKVSVNVVDSCSGVKNVTLSYNLNGSALWNDLVMFLNSTTGLYEAIIPEQQENTLVKYTIAAFDNAENYNAEDNNGQYYVYEVVPEFPSWIILPLVLTSTLLVILCRRKLTKTPSQQSY
jgi:hypothetical protein